MILILMIATYHWCLAQMVSVHVETVVLLSQQKPDDTIEIDLDPDELDATSAEIVLKELIYS